MAKNIRNVKIWGWLSLSLSALTLGLLCGYAKTEMYDNTYQSYHANDEGYPKGTPYWRTEHVGVATFVNSISCLVASAATARLCLYVINRDKKRAVYSYNTGKTEYVTTVFYDFLWWIAVLANIVCLGSGAASFGCICYFGENIPCYDMKTPLYIYSLVYVHFGFVTVSYFVIMLVIDLIFLLWSCCFPEKTGEIESQVSKIGAFNKEFMGYFFNFLEKITFDSEKVDEEYLHELELMRVELERQSQAAVVPIASITVESNYQAQLTTPDDATSNTLPQSSNDLKTLPLGEDNPKNEGCHDNLKVLPNSVNVTVAQ